MTATNDTHQPTPLEVVRHAWLRSLGAPAERGDTNFFEAGGTSIDAAKFIVGLRGALSVDISLLRFFEQPTLDGIAAQLDGPSPARASRYVRCLQERLGLPLVLAPDFNGSAANVENLAVPALGRPVFAVASPGVDGETTPEDDISRVGAHVVDELRRAGVPGPVHFLANCQSGYFALASARAAEYMGLGVRSVVLINTVASMEQLSRREMVKARLQMQRGYAGLGPAPDIDDAPDMVSERDLVARAFGDMLDLGKPRESTLDAFEIRLRLFLASWHAASRMTHGPLNAPVRLMYDSNAHGQPVAESLKIEEWRKLGYDITFEGIPGLQNATIGSPRTVEAIGCFLQSHDPVGVAP